MRQFAFCAVLFAAGVVASQALVALDPSARADDKDPEKKKKRDEEQKKKDRREAALTEYAADFGAKGTSLLLARVPKDTKLALSLGDDKGDYALDQARGVLDKYFESMQNISADLATMKVEQNVASFALTLTKKGADKKKTAKLYVTVGTPEAKFPLLKLAVDQQ